MKNIAGILVNICIISSILFLVMDGSNTTIPSAEAYDVDMEEVDPIEYPGIQYSNGNVAAIAANEILDDMLIGNIQIIDTEDIDNFTARLIRDYSMGVILYWHLGDIYTTVFLEAYNGEIIHYSHVAWFTGDMIEAQIEDQAEDIATQFAPLPQDRIGPDSSFEIGAMVETTIDVETEEEVDLSHDWWYVDYTRVKNDISAEDCIMVVLHPNGYLACYIKVWFMDLETLSTGYSVSQAQAEATAFTATGPGSTVMTTRKMIVRPNHNWDLEPQWGLDPMCVWEVQVKDVDNNLWVYHINGNTNEIVGGDYAYEYYEE